MEFLIVLACIITYISMGYCTGLLAFRLFGNGEGAGWSAVFWTVTLIPMVLHWFFHRREPKPKKEKSIFSDSQRKEIAEIKHRIEMAQLEAQLEDVTTARLEKMR